MKTASKRSEPLLVVLLIPFNELESIDIPPAADASTTSEDVPQDISSQGYLNVHESEDPEMRFSKDSDSEDVGVE
ncbi:hypothetical protein GCK72_008356 [Caenorhabditis remanei]|uniref:Uncharacterized protein n=1 Tax=Caenorhabditis remanei TaxID=31234 RepID=A0A6A5GXD4_CAERE|nr:hypothetical protein GCK72_008356 [Caenorhabditis remanei]KAF1760110.1 hypothetical protein GCK72_008356 [Caenorhabditis remanei]